jgi:hypothetical protein
MSKQTSVPIASDVFDIEGATMLCVGLGPHDRDHVLCAALTGARRDPAVRSMTTSIVAASRIDQGRHGDVPRRADHGDDSPTHAAHHRRRAAPAVRRHAADDNAETSMMTPCERHALNQAFLVALYAASGYPEHSELTCVRLLLPVLLHEGTGGDPRYAS